MRTSVLAGLLSLLAAAPTMGQSPGHPNKPPNLANGVYSIIRTWSDQRSTPQLGKHERAVTIASESSRPDILIVPDVPEVALKLAREPRLETRPDGIQVLSVALDQTQTAALRETSKRRINQRIAIVVDDIVVMSPQVRTPIEGGKFELTAPQGNLSRVKEGLWPSR